MAEDHLIERNDSGTATELVRSMVLALLLAAVVVVFLVLGGPGRFAGGA